jgi:hypothetical protein
MLSLTRDSQMDRAKETLRDLITYGDELIRDQRLRADLQAAVGHGVKAGDRVKTEIESEGITASLASDRKLRKHLRALLDNLDSASERVARRKKSHRVRNVLLIIAGTSAVLAFVPNVRRRLTRGAQPASAVMYGDVDTRYGEREAVPVT